MRCTVLGAYDTEVNKTIPAYSNNNFLIGGRQKNVEINGLA